MLKPRLSTMWLALAIALAISGCRSDKVFTGPPKISVNPNGKCVLVKNGADPAPIIVPKNLPPFTRRAADELAAYIEKISGSKPEVIEGTPEPLPKRAIWVGYQPILKKLFPDVDFDFKNAEEILLAANQNNVVICGRDRWNEKGSTVKTSRGKTIEGVQQEYGTANAVYTFIQDVLGVRWLMPGEWGEDVIPQKTIAFDPFEYRHHPQFRSRRHLFSRLQMGRDGFRPGDDQQDWARYHRLILDSLAPPAGHDFTDWWERFHEVHPEYFALQPDGTRNRCGGPTRAKLCHSNPEVLEQWLVDAERDMEMDPTRIVFGASPNDGYTTGHCVCDACREWDHPDGTPHDFYWQGLGQKYVSLTDRHVTFANQAARLLKKRHPDKDFFVGMTAYGNWRSPPVGVKADENVVIRGVFNFHNRDFHSRNSTTADDHRTLLKTWGEAAPSVIWKPNLGAGSPRLGYLRSGPHRAIDDMRFAADCGAIGIVFDNLWLNWATMSPHYYMLARMAWNPQANGEAILKDFYQRAYGKAASDMEAYWTLTEAANERIIKEDVKWWDAYDEAFRKAACKRLANARDAVANEPEKYRRRVEFAKLGLDYTEALVDAHDLMERLRASDGQDAEARKALTNVWMKRIKPIAQSETFPYAIRENKARPGQKATKGLCPKELVKQW